MRDEKLHAIVAHSTFPIQNIQNTPGSDHFWKLRCRKSARRCGAKHISKSKCTKHTTVGPLLEVAMSKKCTPLWREAHFEVKSVKKLMSSEHFWRFRCRFAWQAQGIMHVVKSEQNMRVSWHSQTMAGVGHLQRMWQDVFRVAGAVQETCSSELFGGQGADLLGGVAF